MRLTIRSDDFGRMICAIASGESEAVVTSAEFSDAAAALSKAIDELESGGTSECYWPEGVGEYRWVFRRVEDRVRIVVLWSTGTMTGWEHVFWAETGYDPFVAQIRAGLNAVSI